MKIVVILPCREEFLAFEILKSLVKHGAEIYCSSLEIIKNMLILSNQGLEIGIENLEKCKICNDFEIIEHSKDADLIFALGSRYNSASYSNCGNKFFLLDEINRPEKTIFIDGSEWTASGWKNSYQEKCIKEGVKKNFYRGEPWIDNFMRDRARWYFKRETYLQDYQQYGIIPLPYPNRIEDNKKLNTKKTRKYDLLVSFGQIQTGLRSEIVKASELISKKFKVFNSFTDNNNFFSNIVNSYAVVDAWGAGNCNVRSQMVQINSIALIRQKWEILCPYPYIDGENIIEYANIQEYKEKCDYYLSNKELLIEIGNKGFEHSMNFHISEKRLEYIFAVIDGGFNLKENFGSSSYNF